MQGVRFVVERFNWRPLGGARWVLGVGTFRLCSFEREADAGAECLRREANARRRANPFRCGNALEDLTTLPVPVFLDWLRDVGLDPPTPVPKKLNGWAEWLDSADATDAQQSHIWEGLQKVRFFRVTERPDVPVGYVLVVPNWHYNDEYDYLNGEGGAVRAVYRTRDGALKAARKLGDERETFGDGTNWRPSGADLFDPETYMEHMTIGGYFDVVEIELEGVE